MQSEPRPSVRPISLKSQVGEHRLHARAIISECKRHLPVILVHGFGVSSRYFVPAMNLLGMNFSVYAPDLPGHGRSDTPRRALDISELAESLVQWMNVCEIQQAHLIGNSMGCQIVVEVAKQASHRIGRMVLVSPVVDPAASTAFQLFKHLVADSIHERASLALIVAADYARMGIRLVPEFNAMLRYQFEENLASVKLPILFVRGEYDPFAPHQWVKGIEQRMNASLREIPQAGHAVHFSAPERFVETLTPFLQVPILSCP